MIAEWPFVRPAEWSRARGIDTAGFTAFEPGRPPEGVTLVKGEPAGIRSQGDGASAGPTGGAWIDSNGWRIRLARLHHPGKTAWVETDPPKPGEILPVERYLLGVADAAAHGGKWAFPLDPAFRKAVASGKRSALRDWQRIAAAVRFFNSHPEWQALAARALLGVLSDFHGDNEFLATEILNLASRQNVAYRLIDKAKSTSLPDGLRALVYADAQPPAPAVRDAVMRFVAAGGTLVAGASWGRPAGAPLPESPTVRYTLHAAGKGRIAFGKEMDDPYLVAQDAQLLLSHRWDPVRMWNGGSLIAYATGDARRSVVHLINYTGTPGRHPVSVKVMGAFTRAALYGLDGPIQPVKTLPQRDGIELHLPPVAVYAAVEAG